MESKLFRGIKQHNTVRKHVLESSKDLIHNLKSYQKILIIREKKTLKSKELKIQLKEIYMYMDKLKDFFSADLIAKFEKERRQKQVSSKRATKKSDKEEAHPSELAMLESKLMSIESKLKSLG